MAFLVLLDMFRQANDVYAICSMTTRTVRTKSVLPLAKLVCYYGSWSVYRPGNGAFNVENIDPHLCTHLIYAFVGIDATGSIRILDSWNDIDKGAFRRFNELKSKNPNLKTLIAVGGWREVSEAYSRMAGDRALRHNFINSAIMFMTTHGFDSFDIDWKYPAQRGGVPADKANFATLVSEFRTAIGTRFLLSIATGATADHIANSYDVHIISNVSLEYIFIFKLYVHVSSNLDFINVMTYDLHGSWSGVTEANAPLHSTAGVSVSQCIDAWIANGADPSKIVMGIPVYGRTFTLANPAVNGMGAPAPQPGNLELQTNPWTIVWDDAQKVPYAFRQNQWISCDNQQSVKSKMEFLRQRGLGGAMLWSIETDDFRGVRGNRYPILTTIKNGL
ncbi:hypothetical protein RI129_004748 [Pyrocoelia pectoralis]|uniref:GH18 domain-containing protein n=1 Tax=Pyrocoelia pectoralis TaxID=417401 RepID=A0AAN7VH90_9COLE